MAMILAGLAAEPAIWRLAAPMAVAEPVEAKGFALACAKAGPWAVAVPGPGAVAALRVDPGGAGVPGTERRRRQL